MDSKLYKFSKEDTIYIKGLAIIFMVLYHLFATEGLLLEYKTIYKFGGLNVECIIGEFGHTCVGIFLFLSGYGLYKVSIKKILHIKCQLIRL